MPKTITLFCIAFLTSASLAAQTQFGVKAGGTYSYVSEKTRYHSTKEISGVPGLQLGAYLQKSLSKNVTLRPGIQLTQKGYKSVEGNDNGPYYFNQNYSQTFLELPLDVVYNVTLGKATNLFLGGGPVLGFGFYYNSKMTLKTLNGVGQLQAETWRNKDFHDPQFDIGIDALVGLQYGRATFGITYNHGLADMLQGSTIPEARKYRCVAATVSYLLKK